MKLVARDGDRCREPFEGILLASVADSSLHRRRMADRRLRVMQRLLAECGSVQRLPEPPSP